MKDSSIEIIIEEYDKSHVIAFVGKDNKNMMLIFGLYDFAENMEFWNINVTYGSKNGRDGLIFESDDKAMVKTEIEIFINQYNLTKYNL
jgi:beta-galactosidase GanA